MVLLLKLYQEKLLYQVKYNHCYHVHCYCQHVLYFLVSLKDTAVIEGTDGIVEQNGEVVIICNAEGGPNNTYEWTLNGEVVESDVLNITTVISHTMSTSTLRISSVDAATHQGNYTCTVSNNAGEDSTSIVVTGKLFKLIIIIIVLAIIPTIQSHLMEL